MTEDAAPSETVADASVRGMVEELRPQWQVDAVGRSPHGTECVAVLDVQTPEGPRTAVLKATTAGLVPPPIARAEPRLLELVGRETTVPVPTVYGYCDDHDDYPAPFYLMSHVEGENYEGNPGRLAPGARETALREAGEHLARLHELGPLPGAGRIGVRDGELAVLDTEEFPRYDDFRERLLATAEETVDSLTDGGFFPDLAEKPGRFADLVPDLRAYVREAVPSLPPPDPPTYNHWDYRYGNLLLDPETGRTRAVLDWANLSAADPAYNLAKVEGHLLTPEADHEEYTAALRETFRTAYADAREDWAFDEATRRRLDVYRLTARLDEMACLPLWYRDAPEDREERAAQHRAFLAEYL